MKFLHVNPSTNNLDMLNKDIDDGKHVFVLVYMEGCGPCHMTRPEWAKIEDALKSQYEAKGDIVVADVDKDVDAEKIKHIGEIQGFPTMKYIGNKGKTVEAFEDSPIKAKDRKVDNFVQWIETKVSKVVNASPIGEGTKASKKPDALSKHTSIFDRLFKKSMKLSNIASTSHKKTAVKKTASKKSKKSKKQTKKSKKSTVKLSSKLILK